MKTFVLGWQKCSGPILGWQKCIGGLEELIFFRPEIRPVEMIPCFLQHHCQISYEKIAGKDGLLEKIDVFQKDLQFPGVCS